MAITLTESRCKADPESRLPGAARGWGCVSASRSRLLGLCLYLRLRRRIARRRSLVEGHDAKLVVDAEEPCLHRRCALRLRHRRAQAVLQGFDNPNVDGTCGCGESFNLKEATGHRSDAKQIRILEDVGAVAMSTVLQSLVNQPYKHGFVTDIESDVAPRG